MGSLLWPMQMFDPEGEFTVIERKLPHWSQAGTICFLTWRTFDSLPKNVLRLWYAERTNWLRTHGIDARASDWQNKLQNLARPMRAEFTKTFSEKWHRNLDAGYGSCVLRNPSFAKIVADSLLHFDGVRYQITDFVVMPNHVHLLAAFIDEEGMLKQCDSWKHFTACKLNPLLGRSERFWQQDGFDHLVRSGGHYNAFRRYIGKNPERAGLKLDEYVH